MSKIENYLKQIYANITAIANGSAKVTAKCGNVSKTFDITVSM